MNKKSKLSEDNMLGNLLKIKNSLYKRINELQYIKDNLNDELESLNYIIYNLCNHTFSNIYSDYIPCESSRHYRICNYCGYHKYL